GRPVITMIFGRLSAAQAATGAALQRGSPKPLFAERLPRRDRRRAKWPPLSVVKNERDLQSHPVFRDLLVLDHKRLLLDPGAGYVVEGFGRPGDTLSNGVFKTAGGFRRDFCNTCN